MKASLGTVVVIGALSLLVWTVVYIYNPSTPLTQGETVIVVGVCAALLPLPLIRNRIHWTPRTSG